MNRKDKFWNPYFGGILLGLVLLSAFIFTGKGLGASGASFRIGVTAMNILAPEHVKSVPLLSGATEEGFPLKNWLVFEVLGVVIGGFLGAYTSGRLSKEILKGPKCKNNTRLGLALLGGLIMGIGAEMARGCASGQALSGGALLSVGSWIFMLCFFGGGYALAYFVRKEWL